MTVAAALSALKPALGVISERESIVASIAGKLPVGRYRWLDVGVGDGVSTGQILGALSELDRKFDVVAVDPELPDEWSCPFGLTVEAHRCEVEKLRTTRKFDAINVRQSAHYFQDPISTLTGLTKLISPGGVMAITHWSADCFLFQLHQELAAELQEPSTALAIEEIRERLSAELSSAKLELDNIDSAIDLDVVLRDADVLAATIRIAGRLLPVHALSVRQRERISDRIRDQWPRKARRANGVLLLSA